MLIDSTVLTAYGFPIPWEFDQSTIDRWRINVPPPLERLQNGCLEKRTRGIICVPPLWSHHEEG